MLLAGLTTRIHPAIQNPLVLNLVIRGGQAFCREKEPNTGWLQPLIILGLIAETSSALWHLTHICSFQRGPRMQHANDFTEIFKPAMQVAAQAVEFFI